MAKSTPPRPTDSELAILRAGQSPCYRSAGSGRTQPRQCHSPRRRSPRRPWPGRLHDRAQIPADHDGKKASWTATSRMHACLPCEPRKIKRSDNSAARSARSRISGSAEKLVMQALELKSLAAGTRPDPRTARPITGGPAMSIADFGLRIADWCGTGISPVFEVALARLRGTSPWQASRQCSKCRRRHRRIFSPLAPHGSGMTPFSPGTEYKRSEHRSGASAGRSYTSCGKASPSPHLRPSSSSCCVAARPARATWSHAQASR